MYPPFNLVVKISEGNKVVYLNTEQAVKIEIIDNSIMDFLPPLVQITMSDGKVYELTGSQAQAFKDRVEGK